MSRIRLLAILLVLPLSWGSAASASACGFGCCPCAPVYYYTAARPVCYPGYGCCTCYCNPCGYYYPRVMYAVPAATPWTVVTSAAPRPCCQPLTTAESQNPQPIPDRGAR